jgi:ABC-type glycerol-3-phosphate transport system permease component
MNFIQTVRTKIFRRRQARRTWQGPQIGVHATIIILILISFVPVYLMLVLSTKNPLQYQWERYTISFPLRLGNYGAAWEFLDTYVWNTLLAAVIGFIGMIILSIIGGYVFARLRFPGREALYYAIIMLMMVPWIISFVPQYVLYNDLGLTNSLWCVIVLNVASGPVFGIFLLRTFFSGLPEELFESARIDGAGHWTLITQITLPLSLPTIATLAVLNFLSTWNSYLWPMVAISDPKYQQISVGLYQMARNLSSNLSAPTEMQGGPLFAGYVIASLPMVILFFFLGKFYVEGLVESGLKV